MVIDTTVFIDLFKGEKKAQSYLLNLRESLKVSRVVIMELIRGLRSKKDIPLFKKQMEKLGAEIIEVNEYISRKAGELFEQYSHNHGLGIMDALIASTALVFHSPLATHNLKHFRFIKELQVIKPY